MILFYSKLRTMDDQVVGCVTLRVLHEGVFHAGGDALPPEQKKRRIKMVQALESSWGIKTPE